jgi:hypothetical protein
VLRRATLDDVAALATILREVMRGAMPPLPELHTPDEDRWFLREIVLPNEEVWVTEVDGKPVGFVALGRRHGTDFLQHCATGMRAGSTSVATSASSS